MVDPERLLPDAELPYRNSFSLRYSQVVRVLTRPTQMFQHGFCIRGRSGKSYCETDIVSTYRLWPRYELFAGALP